MIEMELNKIIIDEKRQDQIIVLKDGQIAERGTHDDLLGLSGYYAELYQKQLLEEELAES